MKILFDVGVPLGLRRFLSAPEVSTTQSLGWGTHKNGVLLALAESQFDVLVTTDTQLAHQQNLANRRLAIFALINFRWRWVRLTGGEIAAAIGRLRPGEYREFIVPVPPRSSKLS